MTELHPSPVAAHSVPDTRDMVLSKPTQYLSSAPEVYKLVMGGKPKASSSIVPGGDKVWKADK